jgi:hypothetical protein
MAWPSIEMRSLKPWNMLVSSAVSAIGLKRYICDASPQKCFESLAATKRPGAGVASVPAGSRSQVVGRWTAHRESAGSRRSGDTREDDLDALDERAEGVVINRRDWRRLSREILPLVLQHLDAHARIVDDARVTCDDGGDRVGRMDAVVDEGGRRRWQHVGLLTGTHDREGGGGAHLSREGEKGGGVDVRTCRGNVRREAGWTCAPVEGM